MNLKKFAAISAALVLLFAFINTESFALTKPTDIISEAWCVMNSETGQLLVAKNPDMKMYPASITKILTCAIALEKLDPEDSYTFSAEAATYDKTGTHLAFSEGETCKIEDLLYGAMVESANDCAMGLADAVSGSQMEFVKLMNEKLKELGCKNSRFSNATGMPDPNHYTTARDMGLITRYAMSVEGFMTYFDAWEWTIPKTNKNTSRHIGTHHSMIVGSENNSYFGYDYATGGKLGWTEEAKHTAVTTADNGELSLICVVLKSTNKYAKYKDSIALFDYCFKNFKKIEIPITISKKPIEIFDGDEFYGKMTVYPKAALEFLVTDDIKKEDISVDSSFPDKIDISEVGDMNIDVTFKKSSKSMETESFSIVPQYYIVEESDVLEDDASMEDPATPKSTLRWWIFAAIPLGIVGTLGVLILIIRVYNTYKYKKKRRHKHYASLKKDK